jgi:hypothetical protein
LQCNAPKVAPHSFDLNANVSSTTAIPAVRK